MNVPTPDARGSAPLQILRKPVNTDIIRKKVQQIIPQQKTVILDNGHRLVYKYLIHGDDEWNHEFKNHPLR